MNRPLHALVLALLAFILPDAAVEARAQQTYFRLFDAEHGLNPASVRSLAQDSAGYIWIGTEGGLFRHDGVQFRRWAGRDLDRTVTAIAASPAGPVVALRVGGALFTIASEGIEPVSGPERRPLSQVRDVAFDAEGGLWVVRREEVWRRSPINEWARVPLPLNRTERPRLVRPHRGDTVHVVTDVGVWRLAAGGGARRFPSDRPVRFEGGIVDLHTSRAGPTRVLTATGQVLELSRSGPRELFQAGRIGAPGRAIAMVERVGTLWVSIDRYLVGWRSEEPPLVLDVGDGVESGGPLLLDHEDSLWMGSFVGLYQWPEPETRLWTQREGLPSGHVRYLARSGDTVWVTTWQGAVRLVRGPTGWTTASLPGWTPTRLFVDSRGVLRAGSENGLLEVRHGRVARRLSGPVALHGFHETPAGRSWLATSRGLLAVEPGGPPRAVPVPPFGDRAVVEAVVETRDGRLWAASGERLCHAPAARLPSGAEQPWTCETIPEAVHISGGGLVELPSGSLWLSTNRLGVLRRRDGEWEAMPGAAELPSRSILSLTPSPSGGVWVAGHGSLHRVTEKEGDALGWRVEERLGGWHGLPGANATQVLEDPDGGIWATTPRGVAHVPREARFERPPPPRVVLVDARVDDEPIPIRSALELPHDRNRLELRFAALSFRDPSLVRYQVRLTAHDPWVPTGGVPTFRWVDLRPGRYEAQVRASLDGRLWSPSAARFSFRVEPPWYRQAWALTSLVLLLTGLLAFAYRLRVRHLLELERQRTRIAMDLHDEIGSGLGSIGILSGLLASDGLAPAERRRMASEIASNTGELGAALGQIVWSLDPRARTMEEIAGRLAERGRRLFAGERTVFTTRFPERLPEVHPSELVRRNMILIGLEALHNAARHAAAQNVELRLLPRGDGAWELEITDDGVGFREGAGGMAGGEGGDGGEGVGLRSMRRRAEEMGAELTLASKPGTGTAVRLVFQPRVTGGWLARRRHGRLA